MISKATIENIKEVRNVTVKPTGTSAHVYLPKQWSNKEVMVILLGDDDEE